MSNKKEKVLRQSRSNRFVHWGAAVSIFLLIITGLGQLPLYKRYNITTLTGADWLGSFFTTLDLHYIGAAGLLFIFFYHLVFQIIRKEFDIMPRKGDMKESYLIIKAMLTKGKEPDSDKYLAEQRVAYLFIGINVLLLVFTGLVKVIKNVPGTEVPQGLIFWSTQIHNLATVLLIIGLVGHFAAFLIKENRQLIPGMFTGYVDKEYVKHRHSLWYAKIKEGKGEKKERELNPLNTNLSNKSQGIVG